MKVRPPSGQGPFQKGERLSAAKLNDVVASIPRVTVGGAAGISGSAINVDNPETIHLRVTNQTGTGPRKYSWQEVYRLSNGTWANGTRSGNSTYDWAVERNDASVSAGSTVYQAERSPDTSEWIFGQQASGGTVDIKSGETVLMLLGTYEDYKNCPDVPASPPTLETGCGESTTTLCVPAYAYAVYQRCGYVWNKVGDTRTYGVWANELNGGTASAFRRFYIPRWGGDVDPATGLPDPDSACMGVAFLNSGAGSTLSCSCPDCLTTPPENSCLAIKFRTIPRPTDPAECASLITEMDTYDAWDKEFIIELEGVGGWCSAIGNDPNNIFTFNWDWQDGPSLDPCDWGPDVFDPCNPCDHWGRLLASITVPGGNDPNCGSPGHWTGEFRSRDVCNLLCDCETGPVTPIDQVFCDGCGNINPPQFNVIEEGSIELICCPTPEIPLVAEMITHYMPGVEQTSNGTLAFWGDQATASADMSQTSSARIPSIVTVGDYSAFSFVDSGTNTNDDYVWSLTNSLVGSKPGTTVFCVFQFDSAQTVDGGIFGTFTGSPFFTTGALLAMVASGGSMYPRFMYRREVGDSTSVIDSTVAMSNGTIYAVVGRVNFANGSQALNIRVNGTQSNGTAPSGSPYVFEPSLNRHTVAGALVIALSGAPTAPSTVKILEAGMYGLYIDDATVAELETYLHWKFGIP